MSQTFFGLIKEKFKMFRKGRGVYAPFFSFEKSVGGPVTFMRNLHESLLKYNYPLSDSPHNAQIVFFPISYNLSTLASCKRNGIKIVQRLDGIYYPSKHGNSYREQNSQIETIYKEYSDHVIFQSDYSKKQCFSMFSELPPHKYSLIYNGVNTDVFFPRQKYSRLISDKFLIITTGNFRNLDMLEPVILALDSLVGRFHFELQIVGPIVHCDLKKFLSRSYVSYMGTKDREEVAELLRGSDFFIYSHLNPPCPNSVLEAIASGLPVVGFDSGSMKELLHFSTELLAPVSTDVFQRYEDFDAEKLTDRLEYLMLNFEKYASVSLQHAKDYSFDRCCEEYIEVFRRISHET